MSTAHDDSSAPTFRLEIFLVSLAAILFEIAMTRVFSFKLYHYFTYFILGVAMLGIGTGGVFVAIFPRLKDADPARQIPGLCLAASACIPISYLTVSLLQISVKTFTSSPFEFVKLLVVCSFLFLPFLLVGILLATIFGHRAHDMNRLYFADLVGAGLGCALAIPLFTLVTPPGAALFAGLVLAVCALLGKDALPLPGRALAGAIIVVVAAAMLSPASIPQPIPDAQKTTSPQRMGKRGFAFTGWSAVFRVDVIDEGDEFPFRTLHHDGNIGSAIHRYDGTPATTARFDGLIKKKPFAVLPPNPRVLIIGAAGGNEIQGALHFGARSVTAVELNPVTISLLTEHFADYTGRVAFDPRVELVNAEGRSFLERSDEKWDLIWLTAPDSYAAMNAASSGAFVLSESYLYTREMIDIALDHLEPGGVLCNQFGELYLHSHPTRTPRLVATALEALEARGVERPQRHILVSHGKGFFASSTVLVGRDPITPEQIARYREAVESLPNAGLWHPNVGRVRNPITLTLAATPDQRRQVYADYLFDISPVTDDSPFFWHFTSFGEALFGDFDEGVAEKQFEVATGERVLVFLLLFGMGFAGLFLAMPVFAMRRVWGEMPGKAHAAVYFAALGLGFMFVEVVLIQRMTLFLGYPSHTLTVTLFSLLISAGLGSLLAERYASAGNRALLPLIGALALVIVFAQFGLPLLTKSLVGAPFGARVAITAVLLLPIGLVLGAFMPLGIATVSGLSRHQTEYVAWAWAINGFFSVMGSVLSTILSMTVGFVGVLGIALVVYALGAAALARLRGPAVPSRS